MCSSIELHFSYAFSRVKQTTQNYLILLTSDVTSPWTIQANSTSYPSLAWTQDLSTVISGGAETRKKWKIKITVDQRAKYFNTIKIENFPETFNDIIK